MHNLYLASLLCAMLILAGCANFHHGAADKGMAPGETALVKGISAYDAANYPLAESYFNNALALHLDSRASQISAHKYLAFIACTTTRENLCRSEFRKVLELDPGFTLGPAEAGHPIWGPVFRSLKSETDSRKK